MAAERSNLASDSAPAAGAATAAAPSQHSAGAPAAAAAAASQRSPVEQQQGSPPALLPTFSSVAAEYVSEMGWKEFAAGITAAATAPPRRVEPKKLATIMGGRLGGLRERIKALHSDGTVRVGVMLCIA